MTAVVLRVERTVLRVEQLLVLLVLIVAMSAAALAFSSRGGLETTELAPPAFDAAAGEVNGALV